MIPFKTSSLFKYSIEIQAEPFIWQDCENEFELFNQHWFTVKANYLYELGCPTVTIEFSHRHKEICEAAATQFVIHVRQFEWWKEV